VTGHARFHLKAVILDVRFAPKADVLATQPAAFQDSDVITAFPCRFNRRQGFLERAALVFRVKVIASQI
jgi:hypothetical protein